LTREKRDQLKQINLEDSLAYISPCIRHTSHAFQSRLPSSPSATPRQVRFRSSNYAETTRKEFMEPFGVSAFRLSKDTIVDKMTLSRILNGKGAVTPITALKFSIFLVYQNDFG